MLGAGWLNCQRWKWKVEVIILFLASLETEGGKWSRAQSLPLVNGAKHKVAKEQRSKWSKAQSSKWSKGTNWEWMLGAGWLNCQSWKAINCYLSWLVRWSWAFDCWRKTAVLFTAGQRLRDLAFGIEESQQMRDLFVNVDVCIKRSSLKPFDNYAGPCTH